MYSHVSNQVRQLTCTFQQVFLRSLVIILKKPIGKKIESTTLEIYNASWVFNSQVCSCRGSSEKLSRHNDRSSVAGACNALTQHREQLGKTLLFTPDSVKYNCWQVFISYRRNVARVHTQNEKAGDGEHGLQRSTLRQMRAGIDSTTILWLL